MIELGKTSLNGEPDVVSARDNTKLICRELGFRQADLDKLVSITSDLCHRVCNETDDAEVSIGVSESSGTYFLTLVFRTEAEVLDPDVAGSFFDDLHLEETDTGDIEMTLMKVIENDCFRPTPDFVRIARKFFCCWACQLLSVRQIAYHPRKAGSSAEKCDRSRSQWYGAGPHVLLVVDNQDLTAGKKPRTCHQGPSVGNR